MVSKLAKNLIGSEIIKIGNQVNELKAQGAEIANLTIGDLDSKIYPIPAKDYVNIQWSQLIPGNIIVKLNGADGKLLMQKTFETSTFAGEIQISLSEYSSGIYFIELVSEGESITKQILKK